MKNFSAIMSIISVLMFLLFTTITILGVVGSFINLGLTEVQIFTFICGGGISWGLYIVAWAIGRK